jgi:hypothetical protein
VQDSTKYLSSKKKKTVPALSASSKKKLGGLKCVQMNRTAKISQPSGE